MKRYSNRKICRPKKGDLLRLRMPEYCYCITIKDWKTIEKGEIVLFLERERKPEGTRRYKVLHNERVYKIVPLYYEKTTDLFEKVS